MLFGKMALAKIAGWVYWHWEKWNWANCLDTVVCNDLRSGADFRNFT